jgi:hypothetical protein
LLHFRLFTFSVQPGVIRLSRLIPSEYFRIFAALQFRFAPIRRLVSFGIFVLLQFAGQLNMRIPVHCRLSVCAPLVPTRSAPAGIARRSVPVMPFFLVFHETDSLAFNGVGNDQCWLACLNRDLTECDAEFRYRVPVNLNDFPSKCLKFGINGVGAAYITIASGDLQSVVIETAIRLSSL